MKKTILIFSVLLFSKCLIAQKIINNPDSSGKNFSSIVTKVELTDAATILHFHMPGPIGLKFAIPKMTYIEDSAEKGKRLYLENWEGFDIKEWIVISNPDGFRYKLFFPPLGKDVKKINYGESNPEGNWFIYKLDLTKDGTDFLNYKRGWKEKVGRPIGVVLDSIHGINGKSEQFFKVKPVNPWFYITKDENTLLPKDMPDTFFGNWYDKYGTLILIATPDYMVSDFQIHFYQNINKVGDSKFRVSSMSKSFEILNLEDDNMTIRRDKIITLTKKPKSKKVPNFLKGDWLHWKNENQIKITDDYFYGYDGLKSTIDYVAESDGVFWFIVYNKGEYSLYSAIKKDKKYILQPKGFVNDKYLKK